MHLVLSHQAHENLLWSPKVFSTSAKKKKKQHLVIHGKSLVWFLVIQTLECL